jgi:hypothetical protein
MRASFWMLVTYLLTWNSKNEPNKEHWETLSCFSFLYNIIEILTISIFPSTR